MAVRYGTWLLLGLALCGSLGCAQANYRPLDPGRGGYAETREDYNTFRVVFMGNEATPRERAEDLALLRAADLTLQNGFRYFNVRTSGGMKADGGRPLFQCVVDCYRERPGHADRLHDADQVFRERVDKYQIRDKDRGKRQPPDRVYTADPNAIEFRATPLRDPALVCSEGFRVIWPSDDFVFDQESLRVARYLDTENPMETVKDFARAVRSGAEAMNANAVVIEDDPRRIQANDWLYDQIQDPNVAFVADLYVIPRMSLGIEWEPGDLYMSKHVIRRFRPDGDGPRAGLWLGDKVIAIDGIDPLRREAVVKHLLGKTFGDTVELLVVRDGQARRFTLELVGNN